MDSPITVIFLPLVALPCSICESAVHQPRLLLVLGPRDLIAVCPACFQWEGVRELVDALDGSCLVGFDRARFISELRYRWRSAELHARLGAPEN